MLYHVSHTPGITVLQPHISSHGKPYVYAIEDLVTGLLFGAKKDDFDFLLYSDEQGKPVLCECYPDAFRKKYGGQSCSVYEVEETGFLRGVTGWTPELVCECAVNVARETSVPDLYARLLEEERQGNLTVRRYSDDPDYRAMISRHIVDRLIRFDLLEYFDCRDERGSLYFRSLIDGLKAVLDGHLLHGKEWML